MFIAALFTIANTQKQLNTLGYYSSIKQLNLAICDNMDGHIGCYDKWNKLDRERQILYDFTFLWTNEQT